MNVIEKALREAILPNVPKLSVFEKSLGSTACFLFFFLLSSLSLLLSLLLFCCCRCCYNTILTQFAVVFDCNYQWTMFPVCHISPKFKKKKNQFFLQFQHLKKKKKITLNLFLWPEQLIRPASISIPEFLTKLPFCACCFCTCCFCTCCAQPERINTTVELVLFCS